MDAIYYDSPVDGEFSVTIIQGKYKEKLDGESNFPENGIIKLIDAVSSLFDPNLFVRYNKRLNSRIEEARSFVASGAIPRVTVIAANNGISWNSIADSRINEARRKFGHQVVWRHIGPDDIISLLQAQKPINAELRLSGEAIIESFNYRRVLVGRMSVLELSKLIDSYGDRLLERNIRHYLGLVGNRVNEAVAETLKDESQRENFYFYNNGITIICSQFRHNALQKGNFRLQVDGLQIVNGGQTSRTVSHVAREIGSAIASAEVLVRVYELKSDDDIVYSITYATNSQNPVDLRDLKANDSRQKALSGSVEALGFGYRLKRGDKPISSEEFTSAVVAEAVLAVWRHRPHQARFSGSKHFGALYDIIFTEDLNGAQAVIASLILRYAENKRKRPPEGAPDFLPYASRFIAMMVGKYLLDDLSISVNELNHMNFELAKTTLESRYSAYLARAESDIEMAIVPFFSGRERTLQRLSATFRRADIVEVLLSKEISALAT